MSKLPEGIQDYLGQECYNKNLLEIKCSEYFQSFGYKRIEPAGIEYFDTFTKNDCAIEQNKMFKMVDRDGRLIVIRPDITIQLGRIVGSKLESGINRLFYNTFSYEFDANYISTRSREFAQTGLELFGEKSNAAETEILSIAIGLFNALKIKDFLFEIGNVKYFYGLVENFGLNDSQTDRLRELLNSKDMVSAELFLKENKVAVENINKIKELPFLFGGSEVFSKARRLTDNKRALNALSSLEEVYNNLSEYGFSKYITVDLGKLKSRYYTGIIFSGITKMLGQSLLDGGRYDNMCANFGQDTPAVGFCIGLKKVLIVLEKQNMLKALPSSDYAYIVKSGCDLQFINNYASKLRAEGFSVEQIFDNNIDNAVTLCLKNGIKKLIIFDGGKATVRELI